MEEMEKFILLRQILWCLLRDGTDEVAHFNFSFFTDEDLTDCWSELSMGVEWSEKERNEGGRQRELNKTGVYSKFKGKNPIPKQTRKQKATGEKRG